MLLLRQGRWNRLVQEQRGPLHPPQWDHMRQQEILRQCYSALSQLAIMDQMSMDRSVHAAATVGRRATPGCVVLLMGKSIFLLSPSHHSIAAEVICNFRGGGAAFH